MVAHFKITANFARLPTSAFSFAHVGPKEKAWQKENGRGDRFAVCGRRGGLRALHLRHLAVGLSQSEVQYAAVSCGGRAIARRVAALCNTFYFSPLFANTP